MNPNAVEPVNLGVAENQSNPVISGESVNPLNALEEAVKNAAVQTQQEPQSTATPTVASIEPEVEAKDPLTQFAEFAGVPAPVPTGAGSQGAETPAPVSDTVLADVKLPVEAVNLQSEVPAGVDSGKIAELPVEEVSVVAPILDPFAQKSSIDGSTLASPALSSEAVPQMEKTPKEELKEKISNLFSEYTIEKTKEKAAV